ncbi:hypothetical protein GDO78_007887 [Eleutherodactylus coqui]|uniref:Uncharacterized protein n=1 Tax=Eleutherodactylus coqui TaxID=57060 RepID=A0A8J6FI32_ELECQ|nr:hypothetical protein GDO78_007887 [Eleutherodactylus coqui]
MTPANHEGSWIRGRRRAETSNSRNSPGGTGDPSRSQGALEHTPVLSGGRDPAKRRQILHSGHTHHRCPPRCPSMPGLRSLQAARSPRCRSTGTMQRSAGAAVYPGSPASSVIHKNP